MGRKPLDDRTQLSARVHEETPDALRKLAEDLGFLHGGKGSPGALLDAIARKEVLIYKKVD